MRLFSFSIRTRLTFWYSLLLLSTLVAFGVTAYVYTSDRLIANLDLSLSNEVRWVQSYIQPRSSKVRPSRRSIDALLTQKAHQQRQAALADTTRRDSTQVDEAAEQIWNQIFEHTLLSPKKTYIQVQDRKGAILYTSYSLEQDTLAPPDTLGINATALTTTTLSGEPVRMAATRDRNFTILVGYPLAELQDALENLFSIFLVLIPAALAISVVGGLYLAHKSLKPVDDVIRRVRQITAENLDQSIPPPRTDDEIGRLIVTFNDMIRRLHDSFAQVRQFSGDASHELRTPLTVMRGEVEVALTSHRTPEHYRTTLASILEEIVRMTSILDNLMTLTKADQGQLRAEFSEVRLDDLVQELYADSEILAESKQITVRLEHVEPMTMVADKGKLRQLFLNLITNAIKYTPEGGRVVLSVHRQNGTALITVSDTGIGIAPDEKEKIFNRFYRVDKARSREMGGAGLGLAIAKLIAEQHRGTISVESQPSRGSTFTVALPLS